MPIWVCRGCPWHMFEIPEMGCPNASQKVLWWRGLQHSKWFNKFMRLYKHVFPFLSECMHFCKMSMYFCSVRIDLHPQIFTYIQSKHIYIYIDMVQVHIFFIYLQSTNRMWFMMCLLVGFGMPWVGWVLQPIFTKALTLTALAGVPALVFVGSTGESWRVDRCRYWKQHVSTHMNHKLKSCMIDFLMRE